MKISVAGLGKLGMSLAVALTHKGHTVIGIDISAVVLEKIKSGHSPIEEPQVQELLTAAQTKNLLSVTSSFENAILESDLTFVAVNTPEAARGFMDFSDLAQACKMIGAALAKKNSFHIVIVNSTITPETAKEIILPALEEASGKKCGESFGLCINPVFIAITTVVRDLFHPPAIVLGTSDVRTLEKLEKLYENFCDSPVTLIRTTPLMAEFIKMAHNAYCTLKMSFINEMASACSHLPGADISVLSQFFKSGGERAGRFLEAGPGFGGPCFPRDLEFFTTYLQNHLSSLPVLEAIAPSNQQHAERLVELLQEELGGLIQKKIAVLGISYKPGSVILENSFSLLMIQNLQAKGALIQAFDPKISGTVEVAEDRFISVTQDLEEALKKCDCAILAMPFKTLPEMTPEFLKKTMSRTFIFDPWRVYPYSTNPLIDRYVALGILPENSPADVSSA